MYKTLTFISGHEALRYIINQYGIKEMKIPYYLCSIVRHTLIEENCKPVFYHIDDQFFPSENFSESDFILYPNYWGICCNNVKKLTKEYPKMIIDNAHAFFDSPDGFACFNAGHKFGYKESYAFIQGAEMNSFNRYENNDADFRHTIFAELHKKYKSANCLKLDTEAQNPNIKPFVYPFLAKTVEEADELAQKLKKEGKIIYRYWSPLPKSFNEYKFYSRLVPIPILPH